MLIGKTTVRTTGNRARSRPGLTGARSRIRWGADRRGAVPLYIRRDMRPQTYRLRTMGGNLRPLYGRADGNYGRKAR